jgi:cytochrome c biogenesis factor
MSKKQKLRLISGIMFVIAVIFVLCALSAPNLGRAFDIGSFCIGAEVWRICYAIYALIMIGLFLASFFVSKGKQE